MDPHDQRILNGSRECDWRTPSAMVEKLIRYFGCEIDLAATEESRVCPYYYGPQQDALSQSWGMDATSHGYRPVGFLNPPYSVSLIRDLREEIKFREANGMVPADREILEQQIRALQVERWAEKAYTESLLGFTTIGVFPYAPQTKWFRQCVMGHRKDGAWSGHAAVDYWRLPYRVSFLKPDGSAAANANVNTCIVQWGPNPGWVGPWVPSGRYWGYR